MSHWGHTRKRSDADCFVLTPPCATEQTVARAAALVAALDVRTLSFYDGHLGMSKFAQTLLDLEWTFSVNEKVG